MGTLTITASGFANLGAAAPAKWPTGTVTFPANGSPNGTKTYTVSDADWLSLLTWVASSQTGNLETILGTTVLPLTPSAAQILLAWLAIWVNASKASIQQFNTVPAVVPSPITMT